MLKNDQNNAKYRMKKRGIMLCAALLCSFLLCGCGHGAKPEGIRIGSLKGPTSLGILFLMEEARDNPADFPYEFHMATAAEELLPLLAKGELDIALLPANVAAALYQKTEGGVAVIDINTLGVLYLVTGREDIHGVEDLRGHTIYLTGKGATPEAALKYILRQGGLEQDDYKLEYKSEPTEVAAVLTEDSEAIGLLPQPFATAALMQNGNLRTALDMNAEWEALREEDGGAMVTGVTVVRRQFLEERPEAAEAFLEAHRDSVAAINEDPQAGAALAVQEGIVAKEAIAMEAIPRCNLVCITGEEMRDALSAYLEVLAGFDAKLVGGGLPGEDFYY